METLVQNMKYVLKRPVKDKKGKLSDNDKH